MKLFLSVFITLVMIEGAWSQQRSVYSTKNGALDGYDPVAFFTQNKPVKGTDSLTYTWNQTEWHFSKKQHLDSFIANPEKYMPQYGGFCAFGCADGEGHKSPTQPDTWTIVDGKLYLNYNQKVKELWMKKQPAFIKQANENWERLRNE